MHDLISQFSVLSVAEVIALVLAVVYVVLAAKKSQWCWPAAFISTGIYTLIFWHVSLVSESILNLYYMVMAAVGWWSWHRQIDKDASHRFRYQSRSFRWHAMGIITCAIGTAIWGTLAAHYLSADFAYLDAFTTVFALFATWLLTQRIIENWLYWMILNPISVYLYFAKGLTISSLLMVIYSAMAFYGWFSWKNSSNVATNA